MFEAVLDDLMWTTTTRAQHSRTGLRYGSNLTDAEWAILQPPQLLPCDCGRPRRWPRRDVVNAIFYVLRCSCPWRLLPKDLPPWRTAYRWFARLRNAGTWKDRNFAVVMADREQSGRSASPNAAVMDSQTVHTTDSDGPRGYDAEKKIWGGSRHALVDTDGRPLTLQTGTTPLQERDGAVTLLKASRHLYPPIERDLAESGYSGERVAAATIIAVEIVRKQAGQVGFAGQPAAGSSSEPLLGWAATAVSPATSRPLSLPPQPCSMQPPSCCARDGSVVLYEF